MLTRIIRSSLLVGAAALTMAGFIAPAPASAVTFSPPGCTGNYVVGSQPLKNNSTGISDWSYGYVQLWYSNSCEDNWARVVFLLPDSTLVRADDYSDDNGHACGSSVPVLSGCTVNGTTTVESPGVYSPVAKDEATGTVETASGVWYTATWAQPGF